MAERVLGPGPAADHLTGEPVLGAVDHVDELELAEVQIARLVRHVRVHGQEVVPDGGGDLLRGLRRLERVRARLRRWHLSICARVVCDRGVCEDVNMTRREPADLYKSEKNQKLRIIQEIEGSKNVTFPLYSPLHHSPSFSRMIITLPFLNDK